MKKLGRTPATPGKNEAYAERKFGLFYGFRERLQGAPRRSQAFQKKSLKKGFLGICGDRTK